MITQVDEVAEASLLQLSEEQRAAVLAPPGPLLILAGAGSGKTRVLTQRVAQVLRSGVPASRVLLMTFTNQAARQMQARLQAQLPRALDGLWAGTFHHLALRVLRPHGYRIGLPDRFEVLDRHDALDLLGGCLAEVAPPSAPLPPGLRSWPRPALLQSLLSLAVNCELPLEAILLRHAPELRGVVDVLGQACDLYVQRKLRMGLLDFDDLLLDWRLLLYDCPDLLAEQRARFAHIFVDEYQDVSRLQSTLCDELAQGYRCLTAVGDDAQSIYRFRGADLSNLLSFQARWPDARVLHLSQNFRSRPEIVALCNRSIACNLGGPPRPPMRAVMGPLREAGPTTSEGTSATLRLSETALRPALVALPDARIQAAFVAQRISELLAAGRPASQIAVLYRQHRHARELQTELLRVGIPYCLRSGQRLSEQAHIKDALAFLRLTYNPKDQLAWARVLRQVTGLGDTGRAKLLSVLEQQGQRGERPRLSAAVQAQARPAVRSTLILLADLLAELQRLRESTLQPELLPQQLLSLVVERHYHSYARRVFADAELRLQDLAALAQGAGPVGQTVRAQGSLPLGAVAAEQSLADFLAALATGSAEDASAGSSSAVSGQVTLSTVHQAKGLEWDAVFVVWLCEGHFPSAAALLEPEDEGEPQAAEAEERRLFYVATTRARSELYLCYPSACTTQGVLRISRFVQELDDGTRGTSTTPFERWQITTQ